MTYHLKCPRCDEDMRPSDILAKASMCQHCYRRARVAQELHEEAMGDLMRLMAVLIILSAGAYLLWWPQ